MIILIFLNVKTVLQFYNVNKRVFDGSKFIHFSISLKVYLKLESFLWSLNADAWMTILSW